ncbi:MAG: tryptophan--tRNA ligase [Rickettsiales bacterium]|nr:MAG: tryptophan--tRNA ligase [Rickettsiales bacterium]
MKKVAVSGIQTSGTLHLGNYLGSIKNWLDMQESHNCFFFLANLHSITVEQDPQILKQTILNAVAIYLACGIDPNKSTLFLQSDVKEHTELAWLLNCVTPMGWLKRMTQFKDKAGKHQDNACAGLFTYPILMAADILLYNADVVPVGNDQKQHLELTRDIAGAINRKFQQKILKIPEPLIQGYATRIMSLRDGAKKMSKSDPSDASRINLIDDADTIMKKFKKSKTDNIENITYETDRLEVTNLINIYCSLSNLPVDKILKNYENQGFSTFKSDLAELTIEHLKPIQIEYNKIIKDPKHILNILSTGAEKARKNARITCNKVIENFGLSI